MDREIWQIIPGFEEEKIQASTKGRIRKLLDSYNYSLIGYTYHIEGYYSVELPENPLHKSDRVSNWIAFTFIDNPDNLPFAYHLNGVGIDNRVENLHWSRKAKFEDARTEVDILRNGVWVYKNVPFETAAALIDQPESQISILHIAMKNLKEGCTDTVNGYSFRFSDLLN